MGFSDLPRHSILPFCPDVVFSSDKIESPWWIWLPAQTHSSQIWCDSAGGSKPKDFFPNHAQVGPALFECVPSEFLDNSKKL